MSQEAVKHLHSRSARRSQLMVIVGMLTLAVFILLMKQETKVDRVTAILLPEAQLQRALETGQPTLAFFHSLNCIPCKEMTAIVNRVYPEFAASVILVDVDVYDQHNARLLRSMHIRTIPTLIFFDRAGQEQVHMGVLEADQLRQTLVTLDGGH